MKSIKSKLFLSYFLILLLLIGTVFSTYNAIVVSNQHLILSELLAEQRNNVEKVILLTNELSAMRVANPELYDERLEANEAVINSLFEKIDQNFEDFIDQEVLVEGELVSLGYSKDFQGKFVGAVQDVKNNWLHAKESVHMILYDPLEDHYMAEMYEFDDMKPVLVDDVSYINDICMEETNRQKQITTTYQIILFIVMFVIFIWLIIFIRRDIEKPLLQIKNVFKKMGEGDFDVSLETNTNDEFKGLFESFNQFVENTNIIRHIEDHILSENNLRVVLNELLEDFRPFVDLSRITVFYKDSFGDYYKVCTDSIVPEKQESIEVYEDMICIDDYNMVIPIMVNDVYLGYSVFHKESPYGERDIKFVSGLKQKIAFAFHKTLIFKDLLKIVTNGLADLTESRDPETRRHLTRMSLYSRIIAEKLYESDYYKEFIDGEYIENIQLAAPMHDIGKVAVPDQILLKPGKLTEDEFEIMKGHTCAGQKVMKVINDKFST